MKRSFVVGSRGSALALAQTEWVIDHLKMIAPNAQFEMRVIKTSGDKMLSVPFTQMVGKGFFTKEIEEAMVHQEIDFAVHSLKDLPTDFAEGLCIAAYPRREDPRDALVCDSGKKLMELPKGARVGTSSPRRQAWLKRLRSDLKVVPLRGNLSTRLNKVKGKEVSDGEKVDGAVLAYAGLKRMKLADVATEIFNPDLFLPAPGQGILAVQCRSQDQETVSLLGELSDDETVFQASAERAFLAAWGGGCSVPLGAYAQVKGENLELEAAVYLEKENRFVRDKLLGKKEAGASLGKTLARRLKEK